MPSPSRRNTVPTPHRDTSNVLVWKGYGEMFSPWADHDLDHVQIITYNDLDHVQISHINDLDHRQIITDHDLDIRQIMI